MASAPFRDEAERLVRCAVSCAEGDACESADACVDLIASLLEDGQDHLFDGWRLEDDENPDRNRGPARMLRQLRLLEQGYEGGLMQYVRNARALLQQSRDGVNTLQGWTPSVPSGRVCSLAGQDGDGVGLEHFEELQDKGLREAGRAAFVLVAGGLGERLGFSDIKVKLPSESVTEKSFLQTYIENILSIQRRAATANGAHGSVSLPLTIMTSDDTHAATEAYLRANAFFGMDEAAVTLLKQEKVACLADNDARLALAGCPSPSAGSAGTPSFEIMTKPHGHGDVHSLIHRSGLLAKWIEMGLEWVCFFQDTNGLVFNAIPLALAVSADEGFEVNSLAVPRKAKEAIGAIASLRNDEGATMTLNLEYNLLDPILRATINPDGDVNDESTGFSPFPGNINQLVFQIKPYMETLADTNGQISEFVNPKYVDPATRATFKSPTRLECMMQDYPRSLPSSARVGFTVTDVWFAYSPVKNAPADALKKYEAGTPSHSATDGELDLYRANCRTLELIGVRVGQPQKMKFNGLHVDVYPRVVWDANFAMTIGELRHRFPNPGSVSISSGSTLVLSGDGIVIESLTLDGALQIEAQSDTSVTVRGLDVMNEGWKIDPLRPEDIAGVDEVTALRGFRIRRVDGRFESFNSGSSHVLCS